MIALAILALGFFMFAAYCVTEYALLPSAFLMICVLLCAGIAGFFTVLFWLQLIYIRDNKRRNRKL